MTHTTVGSRRRTSTQNPSLREPYDVLFALRIDEDYVPEEAIEIPHSSVASSTDFDPSTGADDWRVLPGARHIPGEALAVLMDAVE